MTDKREEGRKKGKRGKNEKKRVIAQCGAGRTKKLEERQMEGKTDE